MKTGFKASFLKAIKKIEDDQLKSDIANAIRNVESAENLKQIHQLNIKVHLSTTNHTAIK